MSDTQETLVDIVAEMRRRIAVKMSDAWYTQDEWRDLCDRIEAAAKRERGLRVRGGTEGRGTMRPAFTEKHAMRCMDHYCHAVAKHPYFCDIICHDKTRFDGDSFLLDDYRQRIKRSIDSGTLCWSDLLGCEVHEALVGIGNGKIPDVVEGLYDCVAVILRVIDVLEGRQSLGKGKPETIREKYVRLKKEGKTE